MSPEDIEKLIVAAIADAKVQVSIDGSHVNLVVVSDAFEGLMPVKKQQLVYAALSDKIADGTLHAINMKTFTNAQWQNQN